MVVALVAVLVVAVLVVIAVAASDGVVARRAEQRAAEFLRVPLALEPGSDARVTVHGRPFLWQALRGRYGRIEIAASGVRLGVLAGTTLHAHIVNAHLPLRDLLGRRAAELPVEHVHGDVVIPYAELSRVSGVPGLGFAYRDDRLVASARVPIPGVSQLARVSGEAVATIDDAGGVWLRVRNVAVAGFTVPGIVLNQLLPALAFPVPLPALPYGLRLEQLIPTPAGLQVAGSAQAVVFRRAARIRPRPAG